MKATAKHLQTRISELTAALETLATQRTICVREEAPPNMHPRERWIAEQNRREGLLAIDQSIAGAEQQLAFFRSL